MVGLIWFVQIVHYPMFKDIGCDLFAAYEQKHQRLTTLVVGPVMLVELTAAMLLLNSGADSVRYLAVGGAVLIAMIWISTALLQVPLHRKLESGFQHDVWAKLVLTNWIRTVAWTARGMISVSMLWRQMS